MGNKKQSRERLKEFYRGVPAKPSKDADATDMETISEALKFCIPNKSCLFKLDSKGEPKHMRLCVGLREGLRCLKRKQTWAIIYDDTASRYLENYLNDFASRSRIPTVRAKSLIDIAPKLKLNSLLLTSIVRFEGSLEGHKVIESQIFTKLCNLISETQNGVGQRTNFKLPTIEKIHTKPKKRKEAKEQSCA